MKVIHLASFTGNIGDEANHSGFKNNFRKYIDRNAEFKEVEIREYYKSWGIKKFDDEFINEINKYDLFVIGGGNFFELCWNYSKTGTTIDLSVEQLKKIKIPIFINGVGVDIEKGYTSENLSKFSKFTEYLLSRNNCLFTVRNDGSIDILEKLFDNIDLKKVFVVPDGGFFFRAKTQNEYPCIVKNKINIGINLAGDMIERRFNNYNDSEKFKKGFSNVLNKLLSENKNINIIFLPHMFADLQIIYEVINGMDDIYRRNNISVAPLLHGEQKAGEYIFGLYKKCAIIIGMRFHSNVCAIGQSIPNIGLVTLKKHACVFEDLGINERAIKLFEQDINQQLFKELEKKIITTINEADNIREKYKEVNYEMAKKIEIIYKKLNQIINI